MDKKMITIITFSSDTLRTFNEQFYHLGLSEDFHLDTKTISQLPYEKINEKSLIILSSKSIEHLALPYLPKNSDYFIANRTLNYINIRKILEIPNGTEVLVVSDRKETVDETIELLKEFAVGLKYVAYYPGTSYPRNIDIAITPGEIEYVPKHIGHVINIGSRVIDLSTWIDVYAYYNFDHHHINRLTARYVESLVYITGELNNEIQKTDFLRSYLESIIDSIDEAVIAIDFKERIRIINNKALAEFHLRGVNCIDKDAADYLPKSFLQKVNELTDDEEHLIDWDDKTLFVRKSKIVIGGQLLGYLILFREAVEIEKLEHDYRLKVLSKGHVAKWKFENLPSVSPKFQEVIKTAKKLAPSDSTVLLLGETGTGKELIAPSIHNASNRSNYPFVGVNFAAISESLLESELFGYEEGAFTGARKGGHSGFFEQAHKGTIFLDEIGDASFSIQNRLLRVLQEKQIMRVGGSRIIPVDIRIIAATNKDLVKMIEEGKFRADLYYRLNVLPLRIPPLRERIEDIPLLTERFITKMCEKLKRPPFSFSKEAFKILLSYSWPGNIRELENLIEYLAHIIDDVAYPHHLPFNMDQIATSEKLYNVHKELKVLYYSYLDKGFLKEIIMILRILLERNMGRQAILKKLKESNVVLTEQQLRYRLKIISDDELIKVGKGRQGSYITSKGIEFIKYVEKLSS